MNTSLSSQRQFHPGQLIMVGIEGKTLLPEQAQFLRDQHIRAVCLFRKNLGDEQEVRQLTTDLRNAMGPGALIAVDQEGGSTSRIEFVPQAPSAMCLGAANDEALCESVGAAASSALRSLGFNWNFAPTLDVNNNPANPVIAERSFSDDPHTVARLAAAWMRGASREGVACCVKHFPGHGDTAVDSHVDLPYVSKSRAALDALELVPFRLLKDAAPAVMTAHIVYPLLDQDYPATLSRRVLGNILRDEWNYDGVVITDSLVMKAIHDRYGHHRAAVLALAAGADMVMALGSHDDELAALDAIEDAAQSGELPMADLLRARARLDRLALQFPAGAGTYDPIAQAADDMLMHKAWAAGLSTCGPAKRPGLDTPIRVVTQSVVPTDYVSEAGPDADQVASLFAAHTDVDLVRVDDLAAFDWHSLPADGRYTVLASNTRARYSPDARQWRPDLHVVLWNPFQVLDVNAPALVSWGYATGALTAVRHWLAGGEAPGRLPVDLQTVQH